MNKRDYKTIPFRMDPETRKEFSKHLIDDGISAQVFFTQKVAEYLRSKNKLTIIFDTDGGITMQLGSWAHRYEGEEYAEHAALSYIGFLKNGSAAGWFGHDEKAAALVPTYVDMDKGDYRVFRAAEIEDVIANKDFSGWQNIKDFAAAVRKIRGESK